MKSKDDSMVWIPLWVDKWIFGSTRIELQPDERAVWIDIMALAAKDNGWVRANPNTPYPIEQLAGLLCISKELLERSIQQFINTGKIQIVENSAGYYLTNWEEYSLTNDYKKRISKKGYGYWKSSEKDGMPSQKSVTIEENRIEENIKEKVNLFPIVEKSKPQPLKVKCNLCGEPYNIKEEHICKKEAI